jgi:ferredoxin
MKVMRKIIKIDEERCDGCGECIPSCAEGALKIVEGKARVVADKYCDGLGACLGECPNDALTVVEREAEEFDEEAVEQLLSEKEKHQGEETETLPCGCPSMTIQTLSPSASPCERANAPKFMDRGGESALTHWPIQIRLIPPDAPFLKKADLLVLADCSAVAFPTLHQDLLKGKVVLMGCPKFDEVEMYVRKFAEIFSMSDINSVTTVVMEVPCCAGLPAIVKKGMATAGKDVPVEEITISVRGQAIKSSVGEQQMVG